MTDICIIVLFYICIADYPCVEISRLTVEDSEKSYILVGVLYKDDLKEKLKLSLLRDIDNEPLHETLINEDDTSNYIKIFLEDETSRIKLIGNHMNIQEIITGVVCAVFGHETENGTFWVYVHAITILCRIWIFSSQKMYHLGHIIIVCNS